MFVLLVYNKTEKFIQSKCDTKSEKVGHRQILNDFFCLLNTLISRCNIIILPSPLHLFREDDGDFQILFFISVFNFSLVYLHFLSCRDDKNLRL